jgi:carboxyl-terminal processing protease
MKFTRKRAWASILVVSILLIGTAAWAKKSTVYDQIDLLVDIRHELVTGYVETPDENKMVESAVRAMVESVQDPFTVYLAPEELGAFDKAIRGTFSGIGAEVDVQQRHLHIISPIEDSPAWKSGVLAGDTVLEINNETTLDMKITDAIQRLQGEEGTQVTLKIRHEAGGEAVIPITRGKINSQTVKGFRRDELGKWDYMIDGKNKIGYVRILQFTEKTSEDTRAALKQLNDQGCKGLILDLRFDPGGLLESAVQISSMFLEKGKRVVSVKGRIVPERVEYASGETVTNVPMVVLANESSASASEVVTGALTDNKRAIMIGTRTFGKGSVQQVLMLDSGLGAIKMTNAYYYFPNGKNIHRRPNSKEWGVDPDEGMYVPMTREEMLEMIKVRKEGDILRLGNKNDGVAVTPELLKSKLADPQLAAGLKAVLGKIETNAWPKVGLDNSAQIARLQQHERLVRQRDALKQQLISVEGDLTKLDSGQALTQPSTKPADAAEE